MRARWTPSAEGGHTPSFLHLDLLLFPREGPALDVGVLKLVAARDMQRISSWSNKIKHMLQDGSNDGLINMDRCVNIGKMC